MSRRFSRTPPPSSKNQWISLINALLLSVGLGLILMFQCSSPQSSVKKTIDHLFVPSPLHLPPSATDSVSKPTSSDSAPHLDKN